MSIMRLLLISLREASKAVSLPLSSASRSIRPPRAQHLAGSLVGQPYPSTSHACRPDLDGIESLADTSGRCFRLLAHETIADVVRMRSTLCCNPMCRQ